MEEKQKHPPRRQGMLDIKRRFIRCLPLLTILRYAEEVGQRMKSVAEVKVSLLA